MASIFKWTPFTNICSDKLFNSRQKGWHIERCLYLAQTHVSDVLSRVKYLNKYHGAHHPPLIQDFHFKDATNSTIQKLKIFSSSD